MPRRRPKKAQRRKPVALELAERWAFFGRRQRNVRLWLAVERASRRIVAWALGCRGGATAQRLWAALPRPYWHHCLSHTGQWEAYAKVLPAHHRPHPKGSGETNIVEAINCSLRQRCGVLVRRSCSFSKSLRMHTARIKIVVDNYNRTL